MDEILRRFLEEKTTPVPRLGAELRLVSADDSMKALCRLEDMESRGTPEAAFEFLAQIITLALYRDGKRMFPWAYELKQQLDRETIVELAGIYSRMMDDVSEPEKLEQLKNAMKSCPGQRLKWRIMRQMGALPADVGSMTDHDYIFCGVNMLIDGEQEEVFSNPAFDEGRFFAMKQGKAGSYGG